ncbi:hypothetical protein [Streptomyces xanthophaeus]|uniref:hypothetical protein n=1 Tax=Streptomyces xanthophaeus TaxID=67385 RepID=UPI003669E6F6
MKFDAYAFGFFDHNFYAFFSVGDMEHGDDQREHRHDQRGHQGFLPPWCRRTYALVRTRPVRDQAAVRG